MESTTRKLIIDKIQENVDSPLRANLFHFQNCVSLIEHTKKLVTEELSKDTTLIKSDKRELFGALISSIYCLSSIYINNTFFSLIKSERSNSFNSWFLFRSDKFYKELNPKVYQNLYNIYCINSFRHKCIVHPHQDLYPFGEMADNSGDYRVWFGANHALNKDKLERDLDVFLSLSKSDDDFYDSNAFCRSKYTLEQYKINRGNSSHTLLELFNSVPVSNIEPSKTLRGQVEEMIQNHGCTSHSLAFIQKEIDQFLPNIFTLKDVLPTNSTKK